mmetsp:Transcript_35484/g.65165  ORF Transcript_35484/g.65165 Transcript_35484/m.65165 type:complete len:335 (-) Transcript_35484:126-1130(-)
MLATVLRFVRLVVVEKEPRLRNELLAPLHHLGLVRRALVLFPGPVVKDVGEKKRPPRLGLHIDSQVEETRGAPALHVVEVHEEGKYAVPAVAPLVGLGLLQYVVVMRAEEPALPVMRQLQALRVLPIQPRRIRHARHQGPYPRLLEARTVAVHALRSAVVVIAIVRSSGQARNPKLLLRRVAPQVAHDILHLLGRQEVVQDQDPRRIVRRRPPGRLDHRGQVRVLRVGRQPREHGMKEGAVRGGKARPDRTGRSRGSIISSTVRCREFLDLPPVRRPGRTGVCCGSIGSPPRSLLRLHGPCRRPDPDGEVVCARQCRDEGYRRAPRPSPRRHEP